MSSPPTTQEKKDHIFLSTHPPSKACTWYLKRFEEEDPGLRKVHRTCGGYEECPYEWTPPPSPWSSCPPPQPCHPTGISTDDPSKSHRQSYSLFMSESSSACQSGLLGIYKCRILFTAGWDAHIKHCFLPLKDTLLSSSSKGTSLSCFCFPVTIIALVPCFGLESVSLLPLWSFLRLVYFLTFFYLLLWVFIYVALTSIHIGTSYLFLVNS